MFVLREVFEIPYEETTKTVAKAPPRSGRSCTVPTVRRPTAAACRWTEPSVRRLSRSSWPRSPPATPADFRLLMQQRSSRVLNVAGKLAVNPKGFHQHLTSAIDEVQFGTTLSRELAQEVFGRSDFDESEGRSPLPLNPHHGSRLTPRCSGSLSTMPSTWSALASGSTS